MASRDLSKKALNGDSPVFTPGSGHSPLRKSSALPIQSANAIPFTPRGTSVVSTSNASSSVSPRELLREPIANKEPGQAVPRADGSSFNLASVREFVPRSNENTPPSSYNVASAKEFQPRGDRSPFNVAKVVEFRPQSQTVPPATTPSSTTSAPSQHSVQSSSQAGQQSLHLQQPQQVHIAAQQLHQIAAVQNTSSHLAIPTGPAQGTAAQQMSIPTGPSRGGAAHASSTSSSASQIGVNSTRATAAAAAAAAAGGLASMADMSAALGYSDTGLYEPFAMAGAAATGVLGASPYNPYAAGNPGAGHDGAAYFQGQPFAPQHQPLNEHLYFPQGPHRQDLLPRQRAAHDFFLPEKIRQEIHSRARAANQAPLTISVNVDNYHSITPLDTNSHKVAGAFGRITWLYKAVSSKNGNSYCLRRVENFRVSNENALRAARDWKRVNNGNVVSVHEAFTTRAFGDSSVVFATDYFPLSTTLMQYHFPTYGQSRPRGNVTIQETVLWGYFVQITNALRAIHSAGLAARSIDLTKIIRTNRNRIRLSGCAVHDVINYDPARRVSDLQQDDFVQFGEVMMALATYTPPNELRKPLSALEQIPDIYSHEFKSAVGWLLTPQSAAAPSGSKNIETLVNGISVQMVKFFDMSLQENDGFASLVSREVENGRIARLMMKLGTINERESYQRDASWAEHGPRYPLKLFRDYVFHQVDEAGRPVIDVWHMLSCLNKLDAGSNEVVRLSSRDGRTNLFVTYKELNKMVQRSFNDLMRGSRRHT